MTGSARLGAAGTWGSATRVAKEDHAMSSESLIAYVNDLYWALRESGRDGTPIFPESAG